VTVGYGVSHLQLLTTDWDQFTIAAHINRGISLAGRKI